ncbi:pleckstrin homology domain-containing family A member 5 isoform X5 [Esox lucius]|uniref:pleckstrin homology domain-containing family A member 5 isoform X5 n=1 Tax=Esox lucius TaxID=8010 RepID=UPI0009733362|nr:pleckstrin homology domain-containing family A member 5 isoform X5 [Esox lucius]
MQLLPRKTHFNGSLEYQCKKHRRPLYPASTLPPSTGLRVSEYAPTARIRALSLRPLLDMAADLNPYWLSSLPSSWSYGVTRDGRIFFINEEAKSTTWLHPVTGEAVITGHRKTPDLPTGWEEGYTFEGARCFINHNERKVTCKHPVSGVPSQDNCIFVVNEQLKAPEQAPSQESDGVKKDRPTSTMSEASNYTGGSDYSTYPGSSPATRPSRSSKKVHNFGKRSNSIKRNPNAPAVKSNWLYKQDSTGMKLWKKRWFVLSDMCLFYYRDEKEEGILGSILLPSFHISMLSVDDHISRKYAFKATHPNMRTYYFCTDTVKEMESWMKVMTDAALVHTEPIRRLDKLKLDRGGPQEVNNILNHSRVLTRPEIQNNERNREPPQRQLSLTRSTERGDADRKHKDIDKHATTPRDRERYTLQRDGDRYSLQKDGVSYTLQRDGERYLLHKDGERYALQKDGERYSLQKDAGERHVAQKGGENYVAARDAQTEKYTERFLVQKDGERYALRKEGERHTLQKDGQKHDLQKCVERQMSLTERDRSDRYGTLDDRQKYKTLREGSKYGTLQDGEKYGTLDKYGTFREVDKYGTLREGNRYGFQRDGSSERPLTKINSIKLQPAQAAAIAAAVNASRQGQTSQNVALQQVNGEQEGDPSPGEMIGTLGRGAGKAQVQGQNQAPEPERSLTRTNSMRQLENWVRTQRTREEEDDSRSITSYQTLPRNMPSHRAQVVPRYPEGYRTLPRNMLSRPESVCSVAGSVYDRTLAPASSSDKRRSMRDDTMWQLYEWQQRQAFSRHGPPPGHYGTLPSPKTMGNISEHQGAALSIPTSPSHGSLALYHTFSPPGQQHQDNPSGPARSEVSSPVFRGDQTMTIDRRHRTHLSKYNYPPDRRSVPTGIPVQTITVQSLQGKTSEELTLLLIKLRRQQAELNSIREHTVAQLMTLSMEGPNAKVSARQVHGHAMSSVVSGSEVLSHHLQRNLIYLDSQTKDNEPLIFMIHTMIENSAPRPQLYQQMSPEDYRESVYSHPRPEDVDTDTKLSRLCEQDKVVRTQEDKVQQLHREKHTLETALLSASQEIEQSADSPAALQSLIQQRDVLQNGLLSTCRELSRVNNELERSWREYDKLESDVSLARTNLLEQLEALGSPQTEPPSQQHVRIQKELWRIQDVMEALAKNKPKRTSDTGFFGSKLLSNIHKNEPLTLLRSLCPVQERNPVPPRPPLPHSYDSTERPPAVPPLPSPSGARSIAHANDTRKPGQRNGTHSGPDYRLYKSEPELTTVAEEMDDGNGDDGDKDRTQTEKVADKESTATKVPLGVPVYPVGIVPPRSKSASSPPESCTIASYVTLRKTKKPDPRTDRPRSAVDQTGGPGERESGRGRMSVEEQLERIRRHQQASLRDKKRSSSCISPSRSPSFSKENPFFTQVRREEAFSTDSQELEAALQDLEEVRDRVTEQLERDRTAAVELERDRAAELELERDRAAAAAEEELERGRAAIEKLERDMTEVAAAVEQEMARTALVVEGELEKGRTAVDEDRAAVVTEEELEMDRAAELELEKDREAVAAAAEELERARAAADELVRAKTAPSSAEELDVDSASLVELEMEITVVEEICYRAEEVDVIPVRRLLSLEEPQTQTERPGVGTEVSGTHRAAMLDHSADTRYEWRPREPLPTPGSASTQNSLPTALSEGRTPGEKPAELKQGDVQAEAAVKEMENQNDIALSYDLPAGGAKLNNNNMMAVKSLPSPPQPPSSSLSPPPPPQLSDGSHFMCV